MIVSQHLYAPIFRYELTEESVEGVPRPRLLADIQNPVVGTQSIHIPPPDRYDDVEYDRDDEEVGGEDKLMMETVGDDAEYDSQGQGNSPERDRVWRLEEELECCKIVLKAFFLQTTSYFESAGKSISYLAFGIASDKLTLFPTRRYRHLQYT